MDSSIKNAGQKIGVAIIVSALFLVASPACYAYKPEGFISIDCGSPRTEYVDPETNLTWEADGSYMLTGKNGVIPNASNTDIADSANSQALMDFRYFPEPRQKYCYELPLRSNSTTFLLRAMFLHGNSTLLRQDTSFQMFVNATLWTTMETYEGSGSSFYFNNVAEGIFYNPGAYTVNLCLVPDIGIPFISSLELRELDHSGIVYSQHLFDGWWGQSLFLQTVLRWNMGVPNAPTLRYPDDRFDRLWDTYDGYEITNNTSHLLNVNVLETNSNLSALNNLPRKIMERGVHLSKSGPFSDDKSFSIGRDRITSFIFYLYSNESDQNTPVPVSLSVGARTAIRNTISKLTAENFYSDLSSSSSASIDSGIEVHSPQNLPLDFLGLEVYEQGRFVTGATEGSQVDFINYLKENCNMSDWPADPCIPVPFDWLTCQPYTPAAVSSIDLMYVSNTTSIMQYSGDPAFQLDNLSFTHSSIDDDTMFFLLNNIAMPNIWNFMNLSHNSINDFWNMSKWGQDFVTMEILDVSHNQITRVPLYTELEYFFPKDIPDMYNLQQLNISNNNIRGEFPFGFFLKYENFVLLNASNNMLSGSLDLTQWYMELRKIFHDSNSNRKGVSNHIFNQLYSILNNNITDIIPDAKEFESSMNSTLLIQYFKAQSGGILLHGNPYCSVKGKILFKRFLCRVSLQDNSYEISTHKASKIPIYVGIPGAILPLVATCIALLIIWRLRKQVEVLRTFQQELLNRKVQPPFFPYQDLKIATKDFHEDNKLGSGAFGAVYKAEFRDKTIVAIKKLFNTEKLGEQVLNDFLNEVVLLTGIKHKNLIQLLGCSLNNKERILVYEYAENGNVADALWGKGRQKGSLNWDQRLNICIGIAKGLSYLHEELQPRIIHRDIKALNVLMDKNFNARIADFGLAKSFHDEETRAEFTGFVGTKGYLAPEYILDGLLTEKADVYSFGILVLEIVSGRRCVDHSESQERVSIKYWADDLHKEGNVQELLDPELKGKCPEDQVGRVIHTALMCLQQNHKKRPPMSQVVIMLVAEMTETQSADIEIVDHDKEMMSFNIEYGEGATSSWGESSRQTKGDWSWPKSGEEQYGAGKVEEVALVHSPGGWLYSNQA